MSRKETAVQDEESKREKVLAGDVDIRKKARAVRVPTASTSRALNEAKTGEGKRYDGIVSFKADLKSWS